MKKFIAIVLLSVLILSFVLTGCGSTNSYAIKNENVITIGVIASQSEESLYSSKVLDGINYASELASIVNMNGKYSIMLSVHDINGNISDIASDLINDKVAAVICATESKAKSEEIVKAFDDYDTPLLFVDCYSNEVINDEESFVLSVPYSYQASVAASYFTNEGYKNGTVIYADDDYSSAFADLFTNTFTSTEGTNINKISEYDAQNIASGNSEFVFIIGDAEYSNNVYSDLKFYEAKMPVMISEVFNKSFYENTEFNDMLYISKFESDVNNYIGADFYSVFSTTKGINKDDVTAAQAYGYDAYMLVYGALMGFGSSYSAVSEGTDTQKNEITTTDVKTAISEIVHLGVTDSINFDMSGLVNTNFVYVSAIQNSQSVMINKYDYTNESTK